ncbi:MAG TPA: Smr/MutS family protein [Rhizomicrobium sp.]|jgi:DNA-nicking Smr family endonuclease|nr:Smr/MutS family protein [Rhizomicrobium sp.]
MKRRTTDDERALFEQTFREARPLKVTPSVRSARKTAAPGPGGLNGATEDRLRRGQIAPDARIDLHGLTQAAAHRSLHAFLAAAHLRGHRLVLVITGKGNPRNAEKADWMASPHGVLKEMVPRWLNEPGLAALIAGVRPAHVRHGGAGALYVYLRKNR